MYELAMRNLIVALLVAAFAFACGPSSGELKTAKTAHYKGDKLEMFNLAKETTEAKYKLQKSDENALGMQTVGRWYTPERLAASERGDDMRDVPDKSLNVALVVTLVPDGDAYVVQVKPLMIRYHAGSPQPEPVGEDDASVPEHRAFVAAAPPDWSWVATPWPAEPPRWLTLYVLLDNLEGDRLFERGTDGRYAAAPRREMDLVLECGVAPPEGKGWWLGWKRGELWGALGVAVPNVVGNVVRSHVSVPEDASLYWSIDSFPPAASGANGGIGGSIAFDAISGKIVLR